MRSIRKFIGLLLALTLTAVPLIGCSQGDAAAPNGMKTLSGELVDYNLYVPTSWVVDSAARFVSAYVGETDRSNISLEAFELEDADTTLDSFWEGYTADFEATFTDMEIETDETMLLGGVAAHRYVYTATVTGEAYKFMQVTCIRGGIIYIFTYTATPSLYDRHLTAVEAILTNFSFK